jgi:anaerobic ribonucleoside-triphosphate reductase activating protein
MRYAGLKENDIVDGEGVCVSFWAQGCPHRCPGCHNPETWDYNGGEEIDSGELTASIIKAIEKNGVRRNLSILGGEPLCPHNIEFVINLVNIVRTLFPYIKIYLWTGYHLEDIQEKYQKSLLDKIDVLIDGPFILAEKDMTLKLRGSKNQRVLKRGIDF